MQLSKSCSYFARSILALAACCSGALAQPSQTLMLEEVVVTTRQREQSLQDVPVSITAFTENTINRAGIRMDYKF